MEREPVRAVDEPVADRVADRRVPDHGVPVCRIELAGDQGGRDVVAVLQDFEQAFAIGGAERFEPKVIEDEELHFREAAQRPPAAKAAW